MLKNIRFEIKKIRFEIECTYRDVRDNICNSLIQFLAKHCHVSPFSLFAICDQMGRGHAHYYFNKWEDWRNPNF